MRDLSKLPLKSQRRRRINVKSFLPLAVVLTFVFGVWIVLKNGSLGTGSDSSVLLSQAPTGLTPVKLTNHVEDLTEGAKDLITQTAVMQDVRSDDGRATAKITRSFGGGLYILNVDANLPDPVNVSYQLFLTGGGEIIPIDYLKGSKNTWSLSIRTVDTYSEYDGVLITLERTKDDKPEERIMEGSF